MTASKRLTAVTAAIGLVTIVLGYLGLQQVEPRPSGLDSVYRAIELLGIQYSGPPSPPALLEIARFLGVLSLGLTVILILGALIRDTATNLWISAVKRGHVVVYGLGLRGASIARDLRLGGFKVVGVDRDPEGRVRAEDKGPTIAFLPLDATTAGAYKNAAASRAAHVVLALGDDSLNVQALEVAVQHLTERLGDREEQPSLHAILEDEELWRALHRRSFTWSQGGGAVEYLFIPDRVGLAMVEPVSRELEELDDPESERILIWGAGPKAVRTAVHAARAVLIGGREPELVLSGPTELRGQLRSELLEREPWLTERLASRQGESDDRDVRYAFVVCPSHADGLEGASQLVDRLPRARILVEVPRGGGRIALERSGFPVDRVTLINAEERALGVGTIEISARELLARANHDDYVAKELAANEEKRRRGEKIEENPSLVDWSDAPPWLHEANRAFADAIGERLADLGAELVPLRGPPAQTSELFSKDRVAELAEIEHDRWCREKRAHGFRHGETTDRERKIHASLVPFDQLPDDEKRKDRERIEAIPKLLAKMGYEVRRRAAPSEPEPTERG